MGYFFTALEDNPQKIDPVHPWEMDGWMDGYG